MKIKIFKLNSHRNDNDESYIDIFGEKNSLTNFPSSFSAK